MKSLCCSIVVALCFVSTPVLASPWVDVGDTRVRHQLQFLNDSGAISVQLSAWPVMWSDVKRELNDMRRHELSSDQLAAARELEFEMRYQTKNGVRRELELSAASSRALFRDVHSNYIEKGELSHRFDWVGSDTAVRIQSNVTTDPGEDSYEAQFDGSYLTGVIGEWVVGVGAIDRWWGPGQQSSLILSNNARPVPGVIFRTKTAQRFESDWLSWIGDWHFTSFIGQMESNRVVPEAKLTGMRLTIKPFEQLEIGFSRAMQWGGEGRSEDLTTFFNSITSKGENTESQSGNQLGGIDVRLTLPSSDRFSSAIYMQSIGEDEAGYLPSRRIYLFGLEATLSQLENGVTLNNFIEYVDTAADPFQDEFFNTAYEHSIYQTGFRYRGRVLGSTFDNDARVVSFGSKIFKADGDVLSLVVNLADLNRDGVRRGNTVSSTAVDVVHGEVSYQTLLLGGRFTAGVSYYSDHVPTVQRDVDETSIFGSWEYRF